MKTKMLGMIALSALIGTALATTSLAQPRGRGFEGGARAERAAHVRGPMRPGAARGAILAARPDRFIERHDTDGDGTVSEAEFIDERLAVVDTIFERRDTDGDGMISVAEHEAPRALPGRMVRGPRGARPERPNRPERPEIDREAVIACVRETIADYDPQLERPLDEIFANVDTDGDGMLSLAEVSSALQARAHDLFARIDSDGDGYITEDEVAEHFAEQLNVRRVVQNCIKEQLQG